MKTIYADGNEVNEIINEIAKQQAQNNCYTEVQVKPYHGKKMVSKNGVVRIIIY